MLARVDVQLYGGTIDYRVFECNKIEEIKEKFDGRPNVLYVGEIICKKQIENLIFFGNTVIPKSLYEKIDTKKMLNELKRLIGCDCKIKISNNGTVIIEKEKKDERL